MASFLYFLYFLGDVKETQCLSPVNRTVDGFGSIFPLCAQSAWKQSGQGSGFMGPVKEEVGQGHTY
jgi:hypothetical protein